MDFPALVYRCPGPYAGPLGATYETQGVDSQEALQAALLDGWSEGLEDAAEASLLAAWGKGLREADEPLPSGSDKVESQPSAEAPEDAPPTRAEMLEQAERIGLKVDGRWSDARLLDAIVAKMKEQAP